MLETSAVRTLQLDQH